MNRQGLIKTLFPHSPTGPVRKKAATDQSSTLSRSTPLFQVPNNVNDTGSPTETVESSKISPTQSMPIQVLTPAAHVVWWPSLVQAPEPLLILLF